MNKTLLFILCCLSTVPTPKLSSLSVHEMTEKEKEQTGIANLSKEQCDALDGWITSQLEISKKNDKKHDSKKSLESQDKNTRVLKITNIEELGKLLTLSDGVTYEISSRGRRKSSGWNIGDEVNIYTSSHTSTYKIIHKETNVKVQAKKRELQKPENIAE